MLFKSSSQFLPPLSKQCTIAMSSRLLVGEQHQISSTYSESVRQWQGINFLRWSYAPEPFVVSERNKDSVSIQSTSCKCLNVYLREEPAAWFSPRSVEACPLLGVNTSVCSASLSHEPNIAEVALCLTTRNIYQCTTLEYALCLCHQFASASRSW